MNTTPIRRVLASIVGALLVTGIGAVTTTESAQAVSVTYSWDYGTDVVLTPAETADVYYNLAASRICGDAIDAALASGIPFSDSAKSACIDGMGRCVYEARHAGRAIGAVRFYTDGTYKCLVR